ncbi:MAG: ABC transporter ATP-binding protein [Lachnospiraceae bacterium]|nr:ABC transporter ATP-binding protein [Lachnospiraceae bacterium]MBQ1173544.1 ABC transporter ATP-binding protein [Lachnospiraceae bacterium]
MFFVHFITVINNGVIHAIEDVSIEVNDGEIVTLIGANGAGKTTILHTITGLKKATSGSVIWDDTNLLTEEPSKIITHGVAHVPEGRHVFVDMTVRENLEMGAYMYGRKDKDKVIERMDHVFERFPRLKERQNQLAGTFSGGEQQMLAVGRALMSDPKIILMDEPSMGLSPLLVQEIFDIIKEVNKQGITVLLVEQNAKMALKVANRAYVLETGKIKLSGDAKELLNNDDVRKAYLGA